MLQGVAPQQDQGPTTLRLVGLLCQKSTALQVFALLDVGEQLAEEIPSGLQRLPTRLNTMRKKMLFDLVVETRATFAAFCISLSQDLQRHTGTKPFSDAELQPCAIKFLIHRSYPCLSNFTLDNDSFSSAIAGFVHRFLS